jgi:hypothetical protein
MLLAPAAGEKPGGPAGLFRTPFLESCPAKTARRPENGSF